MTPETNFSDKLGTALTDLGCQSVQGAGRPFLLTGTTAVWFVLKGHVDVFAVRIEDHQPAGARSYLFSAGSGELLFGVQEETEGICRGIIAVPSLDAGIICANLNILQNLWNDPPWIFKISSLLDLWISHLSEGVSKDIRPRSDLMMEPGQTLTVGSGQKLRARKGVAWIEMDHGNALFLGMNEIIETGKRHLFPVSRDSWIQVMEKSAIHSFPTSEVCIREDFGDTLRHFHEVILFCEFLNSRLITVDEYNLLNEKAITRNHLRRGALVKIASVINDTLRKSFIDPGQDPLLAACRMVGTQAGIEVVDPRPNRSGEAPPLTLNDILRSSRFRSRKVRLTGTWWNRDNGPLLGFTSLENAPVALVSGSRGRYDCINPKDQVRQPLTEAVARTLKTEAHQFYRPLPDHPVKGMHLFRFGMKNCWKDMWMILLVGLAGGLLTLLLPLLTGVIFDHVIPHSDHRQLFVYFLVLLFSILAMGVTQVVRRFAMIRIETKLDFALQAAIWDRLLNLPAPFFRKYQAGELAAKANSIMMLRKVLSDTVIYTVIGSLFMMFNLVLIFFYDAKLASFTLIILILSVMLVLYFGRKIQHHQGYIIELQQKISGTLFQFLSSISKIRIAGAEIHAFSEWAAAFAHNKSRTYEVRKIFLKIYLLSTLVPSVITLMVFAIIARKMPGTLSMGQFMAFFTALTIAVASFLQLGMAGVSYFMTIPMLASVRPILEAIPESSALKPEIRELAGDIEVVNVSFRYHPDGPLVLDNVSLHVRQGEFVAIVGASGSGKSTLLRLLLGFESPETGSVCYDRQDITAFDPSSVRRQAGTVMQQSQLSAGNILTNITGMTSSTPEDAWEAARAVGLDDDIRQMPMGMYTVITGGISTLSGGQRQRIMIARAIVSKPRILFFDEATSALDNRTQQIVSQSLEKLQATRVVIAHRLTTIQNADRIYLMENGRITDSGTFSDLLKKGGNFSKLVIRQIVELS